MTPKEKAEELYRKMFECIINPELTVVEMETYAQACALIAVDELIFALKYDMNEPTSASIKYWQEVKQEIKNI